jgi:hypothetical protein
MPEHYNMKAGTGRFVVSGQDARLIHTTVAEVTRKNWLLLVGYGVLTLASIFISYFTSGWGSVAVTFAYAAITLLVGARMLEQVVTITNEVR